MDPLVQTKLLILLDKKHIIRSVAVIETGAYGKNNHIHAYLEFDRPVRTDNITTKIKSWYSDQGVTNRYTVKTLKETDPIYRIGHYIQKESDHKIIHNKLIDLKAYASMYQTRQGLSDKLFRIKNFRKIKIDEIPSFYMAYCDNNLLDRGQIVPNLALMIGDGLLQPTQIRALKSCIVVINCLLSPELGETSLENFLN